MAKRNILQLLLALLLTGMQTHPAFAAITNVSPIPGIDIHLVADNGKPQEIASALKILLGLTVLSLAPAILISMTSFVRIIVVLSMLRQALGMQQTPPNSVLISLALFLTLFTMLPAIQQIDTQAFEPFMQGKLNTGAAISRGIQPVRNFMVRQTREEDLSLMVNVAKQPQPRTMADISTLELIPAFMLSELHSAFQIGFVIFLPFLLIDLITATILMSLGMMMVPPVTISLPVKILMFVLLDGWNLIIQALVGTFH